MKHRPANSIIRTFLCVGVFVFGFHLVQAGDYRAAGGNLVAAYPNYKIAAIVVKFPDTTVMPSMEGTKTPWTKTYLESKLFSGTSSMAAFYATISRGAMSVTGDIFDNVGQYYTISKPATIDGYCDWDSFFENAVQAANADIDFTKYNTVIILAPSMACSTGGIAASMVVPDANQRYGIIDLDGVLDAGPAHELGHLVGWSHANNWTCTPPGILTGTNCKLEEYGDRYSVMGLSTSRMLYPAAPHMENVGWLTPAEITNVSSNGDYTITNYEATTLTPKVLKIPRARDAQGNITSWYYLEYRQPIGFDNIPRQPTIQELGVPNGTLVHVGSSAGTHISTTLLDMTPGSLPGHDIFDPALPLGSSYADPVAGVSFGVVSRTSTTMTIRVQFGPNALCQWKPPKVTIKTLAGSVKPGGTASYRLSVTNKAALCGQQVLEIKTLKKPAGWAVTYDKKQKTTMTLLPGASKNFIVRATSPRTARFPAYAISLETRFKDQSDQQTITVIRPKVTRSKR